MCRATNLNLRIKRQLRMQREFGKLSSAAGRSSSRNHDFLNISLTASQSGRQPLSNRKAHSAIWNRRRADKNCETNIPGSPLEARRHMALLRSAVVARVAGYKHLTPPE